MRAAIAGETATGPSAAPSTARRIACPERVAAASKAPARRSKATPGEVANRAFSPPTEGRAIGPVGSPVHATSPRNGLRGSETSRKAVGDVNSSAKRGVRAASRRPSAFEKERTSGVPPSGRRAIDTLAASAGPGSGQARSRSAKSQPRRQK